MLIAVIVLSILVVILVLLFMQEKSLQNKVEKDFLKTTIEQDFKIVELKKEINVSNKALVLQEQENSKLIDIYENTVNEKELKVQSLEKELEGLNGIIAKKEQEKFVETEKKLKYFNNFMSFDGRPQKTNIEDVS